MQEISENFEHSDHYEILEYQIILILTVQFLVKKENPNILNGKDSRVFHNEDQE